MRGSVRKRKKPPQYARLSQLTEETVSNTVQCQFESDSGHQYPDVV